MMRDHKPISIADQVFEKLERDILSGKYPQGEILSELRLSGELGVSRTPIREAIRRLEQERILEDSGHGLVVIGISRRICWISTRSAFSWRVWPQSGPPPASLTMY